MDSDSKLRFRQNIGIGVLKSLDLDWSVKLCCIIRELNVFSKKDAELSPQASRRRSYRLLLSADFCFEVGHYVSWRNS